MKFNFILAFILFILNINYTWAQSNDDCINAKELCMTKVYNDSLKNASSEICNNCADAQDSININCINLLNKSLWYKFTTDADGGTFNLNITSRNNKALSGVIYSATTPCDNTTYTPVSNCENNKVAFLLTASNLNPNQTYYIFLSSNFDSEIRIQPYGNAVEIINSDIIISSSKANDTICPSDEVYFEAEVTNCSDPIINWVNNNIIVGTTQGNEKFKWDNFVIDNKMRAVLSCSCEANSSSNVIEVNVHDLLPLSAGSSSIVYYGETYQLTGFAQGADSIFWTADPTLSNTSILNPIANTLEDKIYTLNGRSIDGCFFSSSMKLDVIDDFYAPNTITPNGDGFNDVWIIDDIEHFTNAKVTIYNRNGQEVYKTIGYTESERWDGKYNGSLVPLGTYYYVIDLKVNENTKKNKTGYLNVIY